MSRKALENTTEMSSYPLGILYMAAVSVKRSIVLRLENMRGSDCALKFFKAG